MSVITSNYIGSMIGSRSGKPVFFFFCYFLLSRTCSELRSLSASYQFIGCWWMMRFEQTVLIFTSSGLAYILCSTGNFKIIFSPRKHCADTGIKKMIFSVIHSCLVYTYTLFIGLTTWKTCCSNQYLGWCRR